MLGSCAFTQNSPSGNISTLATFPHWLNAQTFDILIAVTYALRKLIAFVFLGGMFWFIYQDLDNLDQPWFMHALGMITIAFAFFWLLIPMVVVRLRIHRRRMQNKERYANWLAEGGLATIRPRPARKVRLEAVDPDEQAFFHEKGTLYVDAVEKPGRARPPDAPPNAQPALQRPVGRPSDVAFPGCRGDFHVCQRTHCYVTNRRIVFEGKNLDISVPYGEVKNFSVAPGGIVFEVSGPKLLFTFQNPLVAADVLRLAKDGK